MSDVDIAVSLDDFIFQDGEIPESIAFGGGQRLRVHQLPGGKRIVDSQGREEDVLQWQGLLLGPQATDRARYLDFLRAEGKPHTLTWHQFRYTVVIRDFKPVFKRYYHVPFSIAFEVVSDDAAAITAFSPVSADAAIVTDNATAQATATAINDTKLNGLMATMDTAIRAVSSFANATTATINSVLAPVQAAKAQVDVLVASAANALQNAATVGGLVPGNPVADAVARASAQVLNAGQLPLLTDLNATLGRVSVNVGSASGAATSLVTGPTTLFKVAQQKYGDATQWPALARANKLTDPQITAVTTLTVPKVGDTGGGALA